MSRYLWLAKRVAIRRRVFDQRTAALVVAAFDAVVAWRLLGANGMRSFAEPDSAGTLVAADAMPDAPEGARAYRIRYWSTGLDTKPIQVTCAARQRDNATAGFSPDTALQFLAPSGHDDRLLPIGLSVEIALSS
jgi:hypothetical protein